MPYRKMPKREAWLWDDPIEPIMRRLEDAVGISRIDTEILDEELEFPPDDLLDIDGDLIPDF